MTSRKCQNRLRHIKRRRFAAIRPCRATCAISVAIQISPKVTCKPCVPTSVKKEERKALRCGPAPSWIRWENSFSSMETKAMPNSAVIASHACVAPTQAWLAITALFGIAFVSIELNEFSHLIHEGAGPQRSAFLSSFFTLVGTHGLHVTFGLIWMATLMAQVARHGLIAANRRRLMCLSLFWHFLDVIWIGVFTFVYLMGFLR